MTHSHSDAPEVISIAGAGRMGQGLATVFAYAGHEVWLVDMKSRDSQQEHQDYLDRALNAIGETLRMLAVCGMLSEEAIPRIQSRINAAVGPGGLDAADVIFEGVPETLDAKEEVFRTISAHARPNAIIASTTSTILSNDLQGFVTQPGRFLNAHWLNPAFIVPLVELSPGD